MENTLDYETYYGIPFPDSKRYQELDPRGKHWYCFGDDDDSAIFAETGWVDTIRQNIN